MPSKSPVAALHRGFRDRPLSHAELGEQLRAWVDAFPSVVRLSVLSTTPEGREQWLLTIGPDPDRARPAVWIDGNMHAAELAGSCVALAIAEDAIRLHVEPDNALHGLPPHVRASLRDVLFYVLPRMSPDGAEAVLATGRFVRSVPRMQRPDKQAPRWRATDLDGDGRSLLMRYQDPAGEYVASAAHPSLVVPRELEDPPPYYRLYAEAVIDGWDGVTIPEPHYLDDNGPDLNRNFPWSWAPEADQVGAGPFPGSEPESRAVIEFATKHPEICAWLNLHCFGGVFIRPRGDAPDTKMEPTDLSLYRQLEQWATEIAGYPMVSGFEEFTYAPESPIRGDLSEYAYSQLGAVAYVCELWDLFEQLELPRPKRFVDRYTKLGRPELEKLAAWDTEKNAGRVFQPWKRAVHPQLGDVEVGGFDPRVGIWNPPPDRLGEVCTKQSAMWLRVAALLPKLAIEPVSVTPIEGETRAVRIRVRNVGYLPTYVLASAKKVAYNEPIHLEARAEGCSLESGLARVEFGHLDGWGRGRHDWSAVMHMSRSRGSSSMRTVDFAVRGRGALVVRAGSCRVGWIEKAIEIG